MPSNDISIEKESKVNASMVHVLNKNSTAEMDIKTASQSILLDSRTNDYLSPIKGSAVSSTLPLK